MWVLANTFIKEYHNQTTIHPLGAAMVVVLGAAMLAVPRRYAVWPMIVMACFVAPAQRVVIATLDFNLLRIMVVFGWIRLLTRGEATGFRWRTLDTLMVAFCMWRVIAGLMLRGTVQSLVWQLGQNFDAMGMYFLFRFLVRDWDDIYMVAKGLVYVVVPVALAFVFEHLTRRNIFAVFGGVPAITIVRDDRLRCQGAFAHPILAGCFWASVLPIVIAEFWAGRTGKLRAIIGGIGCLLVVVACASSTPVMSVGAAIVGGAFYLLRKQMRIVRWGVAFTLVALHLAMEAPVWHLISRVAVVGGSTAYHRYALIDGAIRNFNEWGLIGSTIGTAHWGYHLFDVTNYYIVQGLEGGILLVLLFVGMIAVGFRDAGRMLAWATRARDTRAIRMSWALGVALFVHASSFLGVSYFGQIIMIWYLLLAMLEATEPIRQRGRSTVGKRRHRRAGSLQRAVTSGPRPQDLIPAGASQTALSDHISTSPRGELPHER